MTRRSKYGATSGYPDWYRQFYVHECGGDCFITSVISLLYFTLPVIVITRYVLDALHFWAPPLLRYVDGEIRKLLLCLGGFLMQNDHVLGAVMRSKAQLAYCADSIAQRAPQLKVVFRAAAAYDTADTWKMVVASIVITVGYVVCIAVVHYVAQYLRDRRTPVYCVNMRLPQKFHDHKFTTAMVEKLQNTPEYRRLKQQRMHQGPEAWNWQTRQRMGERMPSDDMSDEEF